MKEVSFFPNDKYENNIERLKFLNRLIYKPINYEEPKKIFKEAVQRQY
jgi:hypothetical protein